MHHRLAPLLGACLAIWAAQSVATPVVDQNLSVPQTDRLSPTYTKDVAPILQRACQHCHRPDSIGPMPLQTYAEVRPWAKAIRQKVRAREMPPWFLDRRVGVRKFKNDPSLSEQEIETIVRWVDAGAPRGNAADLPAARPVAAAVRWTIGDPDLIVSVSDGIGAAASRGDMWADFTVDTGLTEDRYLSAVEALPGRDAADVVHHVLAYLVAEDGSEEFLTAYVAGGRGDVYAADAGRLIAAGSRVRFNVHFSARRARPLEGPRLALRFYRKGTVPRHFQVTSRVGEPSEALDIPAGLANVRHDGYFKLEKPSRLTSFQPHMHARGKALCIEAILPTMRVEPVNCVDRFNPDWQLVYTYEDESAPLFPAGTILHVIGWHDNSSANPHNPDPRNWAGAGGRRIDEMSFAWVSYYTLTEDEFVRETHARNVRTGS